MNNPNAEADKERKTDNCLFNWILHSSPLPLHLKRFSNKKRRTQKSGLNLATFGFFVFFIFQVSIQLDNWILHLSLFYLFTYLGIRIIHCSLFHFSKTFFTLRSSLFTFHLKHLILALYSLGLHPIFALNLLEK